MKCGVFDLETSSLYANSGIILCCNHKQYNVNEKVRVIRADEFPSWKKEKTNNKDVVKEIVGQLSEYDILIAHNGQFFDKPMINSMCLKYDIEPILKSKKFIDPVMIARRHMRMARNSLAALIDYFNIQDTKTPIRFDYWVQASHDSNVKALSYIVDHCTKDVKALEAVYDKVRKLVKNIDDGGSSR